MKHQNLTFDQCLTLATEFLTTKERDFFYKFTTRNYGENSEYIYIALGADDADRLRALKDKYGNTFVQHLDEGFDDNCYHCFNCDEVLDIDFDDFLYNCGFSLHELQSDSTVHTVGIRVAFNADDYARLIAWHLFDEQPTINTLRYRDRKLYDTVLDTIVQDADNIQDTTGEGLTVSNPYLVTLDEAKADADLIVQQHGIVRDGGHLDI